MSDEEPEDRTVVASRRRAVVPELPDDTLVRHRRSGRAEGASVHPVAHGGNRESYSPDAAALRPGTPPRGPRPVIAPHAVERVAPGRPAEAPLSGDDIRAELRSRARRRLAGVLAACAGVVAVSLGLLALLRP